MAVKYYIRYLFFPFPYLLQKRMIGKFRQLFFKYNVNINFYRNAK